MREVYVFSTDPGSNRGGIASAVFAFLCCLDNFGVKTRVFVTHRPSAGVLRNFFCFLKALIGFLYGYFISALRGNEKPLVYVHVGPKGSLIRKLLIAELARGLGLRVFSHHHSAVFYDYLSEGKAWSVLLRRLSRVSFSNLVLSRWWQDRYREFGVLNAQVVPNCVAAPANRLRNSGDQKAAEGAVVLAIGRFARGKNFHLLIEAFGALTSRARLKIAGDGPEYESLMALAKSSASRDRIEFLGWVDGENKSSLYGSSDLFVLPSGNDSFGMVYIESLSHGCPVVIGPNPAVVSALDGLDGVFIAKDFSVSSIAAAIDDALAERADRKKISDSCVARYGFDTVSVTLMTALELKCEKN